jgi:hypothetical protein
MTVEDHRQVRGKVPHDGQLWHQVKSIDNGKVETACGETFQLNDPNVRLSEKGERPNNYSGNTMCYGC